MPTPNLATPEILDPQVRGDVFEYSNVLAAGYVQSNFDEFWFTLRASIPTSASAASDTDAVARLTMTGGDITFSSTTAFKARTTSTRTWKKGTLYWDFQGRLTNGEIWTMARGELPVIGDVTRSQ